jgi:hypothetical protein
MDKTIKWLRKAGNANYIAATTARLYMHDALVHEGRRVSHKEAIRRAMELLPNGVPKSKVTITTVAGVPCATLAGATPETPRELPDWDVVSEMLRKKDRTR